MGECPYRKSRAEGEGGRASSRVDEPTSREAVCVTHVMALVGGWRSCLGVSFSRASLPQQKIFDTHHCTPFRISADRKCKRYFANDHRLFSWDKQATSPPSLLVRYTTRRTSVVMVDGVSDLLICLTAG